MALPRVSKIDWLCLLMFVVRLRIGCIAFVPIPPDVTKIPFGARFGFAGLLRYLVMWGDLPRWSQWGCVASIC